MSQAASQGIARPRVVDIVLGAVTSVRTGEERRTLLLTLNLFLLFFAYYTVKPIREGLILSPASGAFVKSYAGGLQALLFVLLVPVYSALADRFPGRRLLDIFYWFFASNLLLFIALGSVGAPGIGIAFFVWTGLFNLLVISQTWSFVSDIHTPEQGKRLFPMIAFGATAGAAFGSLVLSSVVKTMGLYWPMAIAALILVLCSFIARKASDGGSSRAVAATPPGTTLSDSFWKRCTGGLRLVAKSRYLALVAALVLVSNLVNTNSVFMLDMLVSEKARSQVALGAAGGASAAELVGFFYGRLYFWINIAAMAIQLVVVSRVIKRFDVKAALLALPLLALCSYAAILFFPIIAVLKVVKIAENATNYSLNNTAREMLFLPVSQENKYKAKLAIDTCFWRGGDAISGITVLVVAGTLGFGTAAFAWINLALGLVWLCLVPAVAKHRRVLLASDENVS